MIGEDAPYDGGALHAALVINVAKWWISQERPSADLPVMRTEMITAKAGDIVAGFGTASSALRAPLIATDAEALLEERTGRPDFNWDQWAAEHGNHE
jgi:hypothetical protein